MYILTANSARKKEALLIQKSTAKNVGGNGESLSDVKKLELNANHAELTMKEMYILERIVRNDITKIPIIKCANSCAHGYIML